MHEFSLTVEIAEQVSKAAAAGGMARVHLVRLRIGGLSGVSEEAMKSCWQCTSDDALLGGSQLEIETVPVTLHCKQCRQIVLPEPSWVLECPQCGSPSDDLRSGRELELVSVEGT